MAQLFAINTYRHGELEVPEAVQGLSPYRTLASGPLTGRLLPHLACILTICDTTRAFGSHYDIYENLIQSRLTQANSTSVSSVATLPRVPAAPY